MRGGEREEKSRKRARVGLSRTMGTSRRHSQVWSTLTGARTTGRTRRGATHWAVGRRLPAAPHSPQSRALPRVLQPFQCTQCGWQRVGRVARQQGDEHARRLQG